MNLQDRKGEVVEIDGLDGKFLVSEIEYNYRSKDNVACPACLAIHPSGFKGLGMMWGGWFSCDGKTPHYAFFGDNPDEPAPMLIPTV